MRRFQSQLPDNRRYRRVFPTLAAIIREEGWRGVYRGFAPKALRLGIGQTVRRLSGFACLPACLPAGCLCRPAPAAASLMLTCLAVVGLWLLVPGHRWDS